MSGGVRAALEEVLEGELDPGEAAQADLWDLDETETGQLDAPSPLARALTAPRKGRPRGARNRRTEAVTSWLLSQHRHPLSVMMEAYSMSPAELAAKIGLGKEADLLEVYKLQLRMAEAVAPYVAQRQPQAVQVDARGALTVAFQGVSLPARAGLAGRLGSGGEVVEGLALPFKSDAGSRTDG
jgi:hypothetical protein